MNASLADQVETLCSKVDALRAHPGEKPTLVYFDIIGIAWPIRCLLHIQDVDHDLVQISIAEWAYRDQSGKQPLKESFTNNHVPLYVDEDVTLNQSNLIMSYLAEKHALAGNGMKERFAVMEVMAHAYDALFHWSGLLQIIIKMGIPEDVVQAREDAFLGKGIWGIVSDGYRANLNAFANYLQANPADSGFFVGSELSIADLHAFNVLCNWYKAYAPERFVDEYPQLDAYIQRVAAIPKVHDYIHRLQEPTTWFPLPEIATRLTTPEELESLIR